jgi:hypothetical protein
VHTPYRPAPASLAPPASLPPINALAIAFGMFGFLTIKSPGS